MRFLLGAILTFAISGSATPSGWWVAVAEYSCGKAFDSNVDYELRAELWSSMTGSGGSEFVLYVGKSGSPRLKARDIGFGESDDSIIWQADGYEFKTFYPGGLPGDYAGMTRNSTTIQCHVTKRESLEYR